MALKTIEKFDEELRKEIENLWKAGQFNKINRIISKYFLRPTFQRDFDITLNFDLFVHTDGGKKWHVVPLAMIAPGRTSSRVIYHKLLEARKTGKATQKELQALRKLLHETERFSGVAFGIIPRLKYTAQFRRIH